MTGKQKAYIRSLQLRYGIDTPTLYGFIVHVTWGYRQDRPIKNIPKITDIDWLSNQDASIVICSMTDPDTFFYWLDSARGSGCIA